MKSKDWHVKDFDIYSGTFDDFKRLVYYDLETFADEEEKLKGLLLGVWIFFNWYPILLIRLCRFRIFYQNSSSVIRSRARIKTKIQ